MINVLEILKKHNIPYATSGNNCANGHCVIHCPFCGNDDKSMHMGIDITTNKGFGCWRNSSHRGKNLYFLFKKLGINLVTPSEKYGIDLDDICSGNFFASDEAVMSAPSPTKTLLPSQFKPIGDNPSDRPFRNYLINRKFYGTDIDQLISKYNLLRSNSSDYEWKDRIIIAFTCLGNVYWTGRSIYPNSLRYKSPRADVANIKNSLLWYDDLLIQKPKVVIVTEGFFDACKLDFYRNNQDVAVTCSFGIMVSDQQILLLRQLENLGTQIFLSYDVDAVESALQVSTMLNHAMVLPFPIKGYKDFGDLPPKIVSIAWDEILKRIN